MSSDGHEFRSDLTFQSDEIPIDGARAAFEGDMHVRKIALCALALILCSALAAQQPVSTVNWDGLKFLVGKWVGEGNAETGQAGAGWCSFEPDLQGKALVRKNHAEYPAAQGRPAIAHDDLMIIYPDQGRHELRAFYTDNEGHIIHYTVTAASDGKSAVFLGDAEPGAQRYRLTYTVTLPGHMTIAFEMAAPDKPEQFQKIIEGKIRRTDAGN